MKGVYRSKDIKASGRVQKARRLANVLKVYSPFALSGQGEYWVLGWVFSPAAMNIKEFRF
jgi:hypothetical protein